MDTSKAMKVIEAGGQRWTNLQALKAAAGYSPGYNMSNARARALCKKNHIHVQAVGRFLWLNEADIQAAIARGFKGARPLCARRKTTPAEPVPVKPAPTQQLSFSGPQWNGEGEQIHAALLRIEGLLAKLVECWR